MDSLQVSQSQKRGWFYIYCELVLINRDFSWSSYTYNSNVGNSLSGKKWNLPKDFKSKKTLLLIGYKQNTQFDIDRWLIGLDTRKVKVDLYEIPTVSGLIPYMISDKIDGGMKSGIPEKLWPIVITVYGDADKIIKFTGNQNGLNARILLLDEKHKVIFQHDEGFSVEDLSKLVSLIPR